MTSPAPGIHIEPLEQGSDLDSLLVKGALDAVIEPDVLPSITRRDPRVRRLFPDYKTEEQIYFKRTGIFPISHVVTLKQEFVDRHPNAPVALLITLPPLDFIYRVLGLPVRAVVEKHEPVYTPSERLPRRRVTVEAGVGVQLLSQDFTGLLLNDRQLYDNMNTAAGELRALIGDIRKDPKKYLNVRVSIF